jgi:hypothetical protein
MKSMKFINSVLALTMLVCIMISYTGCKKDDDTIPLSEIPTIASVTPGEGTVSTEITITGTNFMADAVVYIGEKACAQVEVSPTVIYAKVPSGIPANVLLSVLVRNPGGGEIIVNNAFKAIEPVLSFVNSATKPSGNTGSTVILEGRAFGDLQGEGEILFSDGAGGTIVATVAGTDDWTDEFIVTTVPNGASDGPVVVKTEIGISNEIPFKVTDAATFSPSTIYWSETIPLPVAVSGHKALSVSVEDMSGTTNQYVFVSGGRDGEGATSGQVVAGLIKADGTIESWSGTTELPQPRSFHASVAATPFNSKVDGSGYVFVLGGTNAGGDAVADVSVAAINNDGTLQAWGNARALPEPLHSLGAAIFRSTIYVAGGAGGDNSPVSKVYKAKIDEAGELEEWEALPELPAGVAYHGFVSFGGYLYSVGGETGIATPDAGSQTTGIKEIFFSRINLRTGDIGEWSVNNNSIGKERSKHSTLILGGSVFISSGLYSGLGGNVGGSSENAYANINPDGTIGTFNGATGSNTLFSKGGSNLFNQGGISYIDSEGVAHVMILGGAKVGSPDTKLNKVLFY